MGPTADGSLQTGELVASKYSRPRRGRGSKQVRIRIVGDRSFGWVEASVIWGGNVEAVVHRTSNNHRVRIKFNHPSSVDIETATRLPPMGKWDGLLLGTIGCPKDAELFSKLFKLWRPLIAITAYPPHLSRVEMRNLQPTSPLPIYKQIKMSLVHSTLGGVTSSVWKFSCYSRTGLPMPGKAIMTAGHYSRHLQTALDDTIGASGVGHYPLDQPRVRGKPLSPGVIGYVRVHHKDSADRPFTVHDANAIAPDLSLLEPSARNIWVLANSCRSKTGRVLRQLNYAEVLLVWD